MPEPSTSSIPHCLAVVLVCATFPLIWVGGLVTTTQAGMAVPDWPSTYGYNLFLYPWQSWLFGPLDIFIEHGHRLLGAVVGLITVALVAVVWRYDSRRWLRWLSVVALLAVIGQGVLGGLRVRLGEVVLAKVHGCTAPIFFALAVALAVFTSKSWRVAPEASNGWSPGGSDGADARIPRWAALTTLLVYLQLVVGANLRHLHVTAEPAFFRTVVVFHLVLAVVVIGYVVGLAAAIWRSRRQAGRLVRLASWLLALSVFQVALGLGTWFVKYATPEWWNRLVGEQGHTITANGVLQASVVTAHVANGSLLLVVALTILLRGLRSCRGSLQPSSTSTAARRPNRLGVVL